MAGQPGQPQYGSGWPDGLLAGLGPPGSPTPEKERKTEVSSFVMCADYISTFII